MARHKFTTPGPGRPKGSKNKTTVNLREAIMRSFELRGGVKWLCSLPDAEYSRLLARVIPQQVELPGLDNLAELMMEGAKRADAERS